MKYASLAARLDYWSIPEPNSGCWLWIGSVNKKGYGQINVDRRMCSAHRIAWSEKNGLIPNGMWVCHHCDQPSCINPDHLFLGTNATNVADKVSKGRQSRGEGGNAKLTEVDIIAIRNLSGPNKIIAGKFGCSKSYISRIKSRKKWAHL